MNNHPKLVVFTPWADNRAEDAVVARVGAETGVPVGRIIVIQVKDVRTTVAWEHYPTLTQWRASPRAFGQRPAFIYLDGDDAICEREPGDCEADDEREPLAEDLTPEQPNVDDLRGAASY